MNNFQSKENRIHSSAEKPFSYYKCVVPDYFGYVQMHWHEEFEINYILDGSAEFICGSEKFISEKGDIIITQPNVTHSIYPHENSHLVYDTLVFSSEIFGCSEHDRYMQNCILPIINGNLHLKSHITPEYYYYAEISMITENIFSCAKGNTPHLDMLMRSELIRLFWILETDTENSESDNKEDEIIRTALQYIYNHFQENITIKQLADAVHLSQSYFMAQFKKKVGFSAAEYIIHYRINYACRQLCNTQKNISEIALDSGFHNISNFNRQFVKITGCTPMDYKKKSPIQKMHFCCNNINSLKICN